MEEAAGTLRALRMTGLKPAGYVTAWPDFVLDPSDADGAELARVRRGPPTPDAITRMDESLQWLHWLEADQSRLVWLHAEGLPRKMICAKVGMSSAKAWRSWSAALMTIASAINANKKSKPSQEEVFWQECQRAGNASAAYRIAFPCAGLTNDVVHARARRLVKKCRTDAVLHCKQPSTDENRRQTTGRTDENRRNMPTGKQIIS
ncbi:MAG: hypothetical protein HQM06_10140 [Magnetococcales bacterium]|nr:hypothetical protein [Magnetococcales bacterium]